MIPKSMHNNNKSTMTLQFDRTKLMLLLQIEFDFETSAWITISSPGSAEAYNIHSLKV